MTYHCGTLKYTKAGLIWLFVWLLWGDFCFTIMQTVVPSVLPLKLKALGSSNLVLALIMTTLPSMLNMTVCPYVSFKSDRFRSKWGRRIPFILFTLPFLLLSLVGLGFGEDMAQLLQSGITFLGDVSPTALTITVFGVLMVAYMFFDMFVASVFYYVFNDVVPPGFLGRFVGCFRIVGSLAAALYNYFVFKYAESHMKEIFIGAAVLYLLGIGVMCFMVKEGEYPPVDENAQKGSRGFGALKTFFAESFSCKFYLLKYVHGGALMATGAAYAFMIFFYKDMGLALGDIGKVYGLTGIAGMAAMYFAAIFVDRWHPMRIIMYSNVFSVIFALTGWVWIFVTLPPRWFFWLYVMGTGLIGAFHNQLAVVASLPNDMRLHPKSRFGQFCSAQALVRSCFTMLAGLMAGLFFDLLKGLFPNPDFAYRFCFAWLSVWGVITAFFAIKLYLLWHKMGGDLDFHPPTPWTPEGREEQEQAPYVGPQSRWLKLALTLISVMTIASVAYLIPTILWMHTLGWTWAVNVHVWAILPAAAAICALWIWMARRISADIKRCLAGETPLAGIPHHGVLLVKSAAFLFMLCIWMAMTFAAIHFGLEKAAVVFGIGNLVTNALLLTAMFIFRKIEAGRPAMLDYDGRKTDEDNGSAAEEKPARSAVSSAGAAGPRKPQEASCTPEPAGEA